MSFFLKQFRLRAPASDKWGLSRLVKKRFKVSLSFFFLKRMCGVSRQKWASPLSRLEWLNRGREVQLGRHEEVACQSEATGNHLHFMSATLNTHTYTRTPTHTHSCSKNKSWMQIQRHISDQMQPHTNLLIRGLKKYTFLFIRPLP